MGSHGRSTRDTKGAVEAAEMLCALWRLGAGDAPLPLRSDALVAALAVCEADLPRALADALDFAGPDERRRPSGLGAVLESAEGCGLLVVDGSTFLEARIPLPEDEARTIVVGAGISTEAARDLGVRLADVCAARPSSTSSSPSASPA